MQRLLPLEADMLHHHESELIVVVALEATPVIRRTTASPTKAVK